MDSRDTYVELTCDMCGYTFFRSFDSDQFATNQIPLLCPLMCPECGEMSMRPPQYSNKRLKGAPSWMN